MAIVTDSEAAIALNLPNCNPDALLLMIKPLIEQEISGYLRYSVEKDSKTEYYPINISRRILSPEFTRNLGSSFSVDSRNGFALLTDMSNIYGDILILQNSPVWNDATIEVREDFSARAGQAPAGQGSAGTGTLTATNGSTAITGSGTAFDTELVIPSAILIGSVSYHVESVTDSTNLVLKHPFLGTTVAGSSFFIGTIPFGDTTILKPGADYWLDVKNDSSQMSSSGILFRIGSNWPITPGSVKVTYNSGFAAAQLNGTNTDDVRAAGIKMATLESIVYNYKQMNLNKRSGLAGFTAGPITSETLGPYSYSTSAGSTYNFNLDLPRSVKARLQKFRSYKGIF